MEMSDGPSSQGHDGNAETVRIVHWCWVPTKWNRMEFPPGQTIDQEYVLTRCEGAPLQSRTAHINVLWQCSKSRGIFWAPEVTAQDPATSYQAYVVPGVVPRLDPSLFEE